MLASILKTVYISSVSLALFGIGLFVYANVHIMSFVQDIYISPQSLDPAPVALVFAGGAYEDGTLSEMTAERVRRAVELYKMGKVDKIMMTGDDGNVAVNEIDPMRRYALSLGTVERDILQDPHGYNTYASCARAADIYRFNYVIAVSQKFHLPRIIYFCEAQGIRTHGYPADSEDLQLSDKLWGLGLREMLARLKGFCQMELTRPGADLLPAKLKPLLYHSRAVF